VKIASRVATAGETRIEPGLNHMPAATRPATNSRTRAGIAIQILPAFLGGWAFFAVPGAAINTPPIKLDPPLLFIRHKKSALNRWGFHDFGAVDFNFTQCVLLSPDASRKVNGVTPTQTTCGLIRPARTPPPVLEIVTAMAPWSGAGFSESKIPKSRYVGDADNLGSPENSGTVISAPANYVKDELEIRVRTKLHREIHCFKYNMTCIIELVIRFGI
jgi:hypothetical protein